MNYIQLRFLKFTDLGQKNEESRREKKTSQKIAPKENDYSLSNKCLEL